MPGCTICCVDCGWEVFRHGQGAEDGAASAGIPGTWEMDGLESFSRTWEMRGQLAEEERTVTLCQRELWKETRMLGRRLSTPEIAATRGEGGCGGGFCGSCNETELDFSGMIRMMESAF